MIKKIHSHFVKVLQLLNPNKENDSPYYDLKKNFINNEHRDYVGGKWDEIGKLQFNFLKKMGLNPEHKFIDIGCGSLRGGVHFIRYLNNDNYFGTDITYEIINVGIEKELKPELRSKINMNNFIANSDFKIPFNEYFDFGLALSVFTHLKEKNIELCLRNLHKRFKHGKFYATFFVSNDSNYLSMVKQKDGVFTFHNKDPYHYTVTQIKNMAKNCKWKVKEIKSFIHPRNQKMFEFYK
jgi:SAM-dependent methyltransferase